MARHRQSKRRAKLERLAIGKALEVVRGALDGVVLDLAIEEVMHRDSGGIWAEPVGQLPDDVGTYAGLPSVRRDYR